MVKLPMVVGEKYNWKNQPERLIYKGKSGSWHQFSKVDKPHEIWCEVLDEDLRMLERTKITEQQAFDDWLEFVKPSGDADSVHQQWALSIERAHWVDKNILSGGE